MSSEVKEAVSPLGSMNKPTDPNFKNDIRAMCGENVLSCYQCGECTAGCPAAFAMDIAPNQVMRMAQLGFADEVLGSSSIWLCAGCETCATRCPRGVALSKVMDACRQLSVKQGKVTKDQANVLKLHEEILRQVIAEHEVVPDSLLARHSRIEDAEYEKAGQGASDHQARQPQKVNSQEVVSTDPDYA